MANPSQMTGAMVTSGHCPSAPVIAMMQAFGTNNLQQDYHAEFSACAPDRHSQFHSAGYQYPVLVPAVVHSGYPETDCSPQGLPGAVHQGHYLGVGILGGLQYRRSEEHTSELQSRPH